MGKEIREMIRQYTSEIIEKDKRDKEIKKKNISLVTENVWLLVTCVCITIISYTYVFINLEEIYYDYNKREKIVFYFILKFALTSIPDSKGDFPNSKKSTILRYFYGSPILSLLFGMIGTVWKEIDELVYMRNPFYYNIVISRKDGRIYRIPKNINDYSKALSQNEYTLVTPDNKIESAENYFKPNGDLKEHFGTLPILYI